MRHQLTFVILACLIAAPLGAADRIIQIERIEVEDGDTLVAEIDGEAQRLQLIYIDAPEDRDNAKLRHDLSRTGLDADTLLNLGRDATAHLRKLTDGRGPFLIEYNPGFRDRYGRITVEVSDHGGHSLGTAMVDDGYARVLAPRTAGDPAPPPALAESEREARDAGRGIWGTYGETAEAWREKRR